MQTTTFRTKNFFYYTTVIVQKIQISVINRTMFSISKTWVQLTAKPNFELKRQTFLALQMPYVFPQCSIANREAFVMVWRDCVCCWDEQDIPALRFSDMIQRFPRPVSVLNLITNEVMDFIYDNHCHLVTEWNRDILSSVALQRFAETISRKGSLLINCFGFINGKVRPISRPWNGQRIVYNGHKRVHGLKFQSISLPNELIGNIFGPLGKNLNIFTEYQ